MKFFCTATRTASRGTAAPGRMLSNLALCIGLIVAPAAVLAQGTPDGQTPAEESVCDSLDGALFGLCNAYCEATDCGDGVNYANWHACASLEKNWTRKTGLDEFPCECASGETFTLDAGCECAVDLTVTVLDTRSLGCPTGAGSCTHEVDIEVMNLGVLDSGPFRVLVELLNIGRSVVVDFPAGLGGGAVEQRLNIFVGPEGENCFNGVCQTMATADPANDVEECDETNNTDLLEILG